MGIDNLLPLLHPITQKLHLSSFAGKTLAIDISPWLYKACYQNIMQMDHSALHSQFQDPTNQVVPNNSYSQTKASCIPYLLEMISLFEQSGVKMIFVYDGRSLKMKQNTIKKRKETRQNNLQKGRSAQHQNDGKQMRKFLARGIRISEPIIQESMRVLKSKKIDFIVAPYQSDSQLCKMYRMSLIDAVVSEDSDLIVYGCKVLYKLDQEGMCEYIDLQNKDGIMREEHEYKKGKKMDIGNLTKFLDLDPDLRILACILAGCDYVPSVKGIGIVKAINLVTNEPDAPKLIQKLRQDHRLGQNVPQGYEFDLEKAFIIFKHALVYNMHTNILEPLAPLQTMGSYQLNVIGEYYPQYIELFIHSGHRNSYNFQTRNLEPLPSEMLACPQIKPVSLTTIKRQMQCKYKQTMDVESDCQFRSVAGESQMMEAFYSCQNELETCQQDYVNLCVEHLLL